jgi:peptidase E
MTLPAETKRQPQIIAIGGCGFSMDPPNAALIGYILAQTGVASEARVCFVPTASGDSATYIEAFYKTFSQFNCRTSHLPFFDRTPDLTARILNQDLIYVGGGNTKSMLAVWKEWGFDALLRQAWEAGIVLAGTSAGAICWFQQGITDSFANELHVIDCLGFLQGSCCPHYDGEVERRPSFHRMLKENTILPGYALEDYSAIHFKGTAVAGVVASRPAAKVYRMQFSAGEVVEDPLERTLIGLINT